MLASFSATRIPLRSVILSTKRLPQTSVKAALSASHMTAACRAIGLSSRLMSSSSMPSADESKPLQTTSAGVAAPTVPAPAAGSGKKAGKTVETAPQRGMKDMFPDVTMYYRYIEDTFAKAAMLHGYGEVRTPILEHRDVFCETLGKGSEVVTKQMYSFQDYDTPVVMRPENTASVMRATVRRGIVLPPSLPSNPVSSSSSSSSSPASSRSSSSTSPAVSPGAESSYYPDKFFYYGPMFRRERPQAGRLRQFEQFGIECAHADHPHEDAQVVALASTVLQQLGLGDDIVELRINTIGTPEDRLAYAQSLTTYLSQYAHMLSPESQARLKEGYPFRVLDSKDLGDNIIVRGVEYARSRGLSIPSVFLDPSSSSADVSAAETDDSVSLSTPPPPPPGAPTVLESLSASSLARHKAVLAALRGLGVPFVEDPLLFRGLDYYSHTAFEFVVKDNSVAQSAVLAGGRYDGLSLRFGKQAIPAIGWAAGVSNVC